MSVNALKEANKHRPLEPINAQSLRYSVHYDTPFIVFSDVHCRIELVEKLRLKHPNIPGVCLGDITNMGGIQPVNERSLSYFMAQPDIICLRGNHDRAIRYRCAAEMNQLEFIRYMSLSLTIVTPKGEYLCYHSLPKDEDTFVKPEVTEDQFLKAYPLHLAKNPLAVLIGHNHGQWTKNFVSTPTKLISVGALCDAPHPYLLITPAAVNPVQALTV